MKCIKCGRDIPDGELFCENCSKTPAQHQSAPAAPSRPTKKQPQQEKQSARQSSQRPKQVQPPVRQQAAKKSAVEPETMRQRKKPVKLIVCLVLACCAVAGLLAFIFLNWSDLTLQKTNLRVREADLVLREAEIDKLEQELEAAGKERDEAEQKSQTLEEENQDLKRQLSGTQSTMSQTQFDMTSQQQELEKLTQENEALLGMVDDLEQQKSELDGKVSGLTASNATYGAKADFMDSYVVFVNNDGSKYYHKYDCKDFKRQSFWAYSRKLAESSGFAACPSCCG